MLPLSATRSARLPSISIISRSGAITSASLATPSRPPTLTKLEGAGNRRFVTCSNQPLQHAGTSSISANGRIGSSGLYISSGRSLKSLQSSRAFATVSDPLSPSLPLSAVQLPKEPIMSSPFPPVPPIPKATGPVDLILPPTEDRKHRYFTLPNGMEVIVVSDPKADKSAASMDVGVGHLNDPDDLPGCAHFCEHLLFMGTKKYPVENAYQQYLSSHNGGSNAYTAMTSTVFFFDVAADALEGALDRFSGFFNEPLFNEDCTEREIQAVDSEHKKNLQNDMWRFFQLEKHVFKENHPYHKFGTGNYETLWSIPKSKGRDPRQQLIDWWAKYYCARRMKLAVVGKEDLDTLEKWVRERFEQTPVRSEGAAEVGPEGVRIAFEDSPMTPDHFGVATFVKPVQDARGLEVTFPFPDLDHLFQTKPSQYLSHFLGHEGPGSLLSYLKKQGWCNYLRAGTSHGATGFDLMKITTDLTPSGLEHWKDVAMAIFKYTNLLRTQPPSQTAFDEIKAIAGISFKFAEKTKNGRYATALSNAMQSPYPREKIVSGGSLLEEFNGDHLASALQLLDPRKAHLGIIGKELPKDVEGTFNLTEPIYGTEYKHLKLSDKFIQEAISGAPIPELQLPGKNLFIPERLDVEKFEVKEPALRPTMIKDTDVSRLWYKRDDRFWLPKANVNVMLQSPILNNTPRNAVLARLWADLFRDSVTEETYDAELAELSFNIAYSPEAIGIGAAGFSDKLAVLLETMLGKLMAWDVDMKRFDGIVDELKLTWKNFPLSEPYSQVAYWSAYTTTQVMWTPEEKLKELDRITVDQVKTFGQEMLSRLYIETLIHGNTSKEGAQEIQDMIERVLHPAALAEAEKASIRSLTLPPNSEHVWAMDLPNKDEPNSAITYSTYVGDLEDQKLRATLSLFAQIAHEPTFDRLRTKEQLGYITDSRATQSIGMMGFRILVQSERDPVYVETRIEAFLDWLKEHIESMTEEEFEKQKMALIAKKEETPKNLGEETKRFWGPIGDKYYEFGKRQTDIANLKNTTKADVLSLFMTRIHPSSSTRSKLSTHMKSTFKGSVFDPDSAKPLIEGLKKHGIEIPEESIKALFTSNPKLVDVKAFGKSAIAQAGESGLSAEGKKELEGLLGELKEKEAGADSKVDGQEVKLREGNVFIKDIHQFKAGLIPSKAATPLEPLSAMAKL